MVMDVYNTNGSMCNPAFFAPHWHEDIALAQTSLIDIVEIWSQNNF